MTINGVEVKHDYCEIRDQIRLQLFVAWLYKTPNPISRRLNLGG